MQTVAITAERPLLEGVFGPLTPTQDRVIRGAIVEMSFDLVDCATRLGTRAGWSGAGLELRWMESGQTDIGSFVEADDASGRRVAFVVELRPAWYYGAKTGHSAWEVELSVEVDCQHSPDHGSHTVFEQIRTEVSPEDAVAALHRATATLIDFATNQPLSDWREARDV
jgi:hypothetical protein